MTCPNCSHKDTSVYSSRPKGLVVRRRRKCPKCLCRWSTLETVVEGRKGYSGRVLVDNNL